MKIVHVVDNRYALEAMPEELPQIVPVAKLHYFDHPDPALAFARLAVCS